MNKLFIITGPAGVGKTTISNKLASSLSKSVLIEGDTVYNFFVGGRISPWKENAPIELFWENCIYLINSYLEKGYDVVFNYIISDENLKLLKEKFKNYKIVFKVLLTDENTLLERDKEREEDCQMKERCLVLLNQFKNYNFDKKDIIDTSNLAVKEITNLLLEAYYEN